MAQAAPSPERPSRADEPAYRDAWQALRHSHLALFERVESALSEADLPDLAWYDVLVQLDGSASPQRPKDLLGHVSVTKSGLTRLLDRIEKAGLIERSYCPSDRRGTFLSITKEGRKTLSQMKPVRDRVFDDHFVETLSTEDAEMVSELLGRVLTSTIGGLEEHGDCNLDD
jgi:DNA-binding MarR family transcriptional regulator